MKLIKKLFYTIVALVILCCAGILVCALSPGLTQSLAVTLQKYGIAGTHADPAGTGTGTPDIANGAGNPMVGESGIAAGVLANEGGAAYVAPIRGSLNLPQQVLGLNGYEPVAGTGEELAEEQAEELGASLRIGETGDGLTFNETFYPYYHMLNPTMQHIYRQIYANAMALNTSFAPVERVNTAQLKNVFEAVYNDHPELFWVETGYSCKYRSDGTCVEVTLLYNRTAQNLEQSKAEFDAQAKAILNGVNASDTEEAKERYVHDALLKKAEYGTTAAMNQSAYSALVNGDTVCAGYSRAFQYLMQQLGVPCYYCTGYSGEDHAWNIIQLDDGYYNVDTTWDDTDPATYDFYNKTDADFVSTHVRTGLSVYLPGCGNGFSGASGSSAVPEGITLNPNPQQPLTWTEKERPKEEKPQENKPGVTVSGNDIYDLDKAGLTKDMVLDSLDKYYENCKTQIKGRGYGAHTFSNVVPKNVLSQVEASYGSGAYQKGYVEEGLKAVELENFAVQIQVVDLGGGYYRLYHNICVW